MKDEEVVGLVLDDLFSRERLSRRQEVLNKHEDWFDVLPELDRRELIQPWKERFLMVLPAGLALARAEHRDQLAAWVDGTKEAFAQANRSDESKEWTIDELSYRTRLSPFAVKIALLYRARFLTGSLGVGFSDVDGLPFVTQFGFEIRRPTQTLVERIESASAPLVVQAVTPPAPDLRARLTKGDAPKLPARPTEPPLVLPEDVGSRTGILRSSSIDILLLTATVDERDALLKRIRPFEGRERLLRVHAGPSTFYLGLLGQVRVAVVRCKAGSIPRDGSALTTNDAVRRIRPRGVIAVGFAFGGYTNKLMMGDVLVSTSVVSYDVIRKQPGGDVSRSAQPDAGQLLLNRFREATGFWSFDRGDGTSSRIIEGMILSGEELIDDLDRKVQLFTAYPEAVGGEMEGSGLYAAASKNWLTEWLIVKAVCDWADGQKDNSYHALAAAAAASLVEFVLSMPGALIDLPRQHPPDYDDEDPPLVEPSTQPEAAAQPAASTPRQQAAAPTQPEGTEERHPSRVDYERPRDLRTLRRLLTTIPASKLDHYLEIALDGLILNETFFLWESFNAEVRSSSFHVFDTSLMERVRAFWNGWQRSLSFGEHFMPRNFHPPSYLFSPSLPHTMIDERQAIRDDYNDAVHEARDAYASLMEYVKVSYPEIDLEETDVAGRKLLHSWMKDDGEDTPSRPQRRSTAQTPQTTRPAHSAKRASTSKEKRTRQADKTKSKKARPGKKRTKKPVQGRIARR